ncbi:MAG: hypothetical protein JJT94_15330 [Bernardetiaceae bacterium]|nr:hypothetical protein [Bernardetiaceae bacterium]
MQNLFKFAFVAIAIMLFSFGSVESGALCEDSSYSEVEAERPCPEIVVHVTITSKVENSDGTTRYNGRATTACKDTPNVINRQGVRWTMTYDTKNAQVIDITVEGQTPPPSLYNSLEQYALDNWL